MTSWWQKWRKSRWWIRWGISILIVIPLFYLVENLRGHFAWKRCLDHYASLGISLNIEDYKPEDIPDSINLAEQPWTRSFFPLSGTTPTHFFPPEDWRIRLERANSSDQRAAIFRELLETLEAHSDDIDHLETSAIEMDYEARMVYPDPTGVYWDTSLLNKSTELLSIKTRAHMALGDYESGLRTMDSMLTLIKKSSSHSLIELLIGQKHRTDLSRYFIEQIDLAEVGETHLRELAEILDRHAISDPWQSLNRERSMYLVGLDELENERFSSSQKSISYMLPAVTKPKTFHKPGLSETYDAYRVLVRGFASTVYLIAPSGWFDQNRAIASYALDQDPGRRLDAERKMKRYTPYNAFAKLFGLSLQQLLQHIYKADRKFLELKTTVAIERFKRKTGNYPRTLEELVPVFLSTVPDDPATSLPVNYSLTGDSELDREYRFEWPPLTPTP